MNPAEFRTTYSWLEAVDLGPQLVLLAEELPGSEQLGLCWHLQQCMVELPAAIALDLTQAGNTRMTVAMRLIATLEIIERVYPALDTLALRQDVDDLLIRLVSDRFAERVESATPPPAEVAPAPAPMPVAPAVPEASIAPPAEFQPATTPAPTSVPVVPGGPVAAPVPQPSSETNV